MAIRARAQDPAFHQQRGLSKPVADALPRHEPRLPGQRPRKSYLELPVVPTREAPAGELAARRDGVRVFPRAAHVSGSIAPRRFPGRLLRT